MHVIRKIYLPLLLFFILTFLIKFKKNTRPKSSIIYPDFKISSNFYIPGLTILSIDSST